jgi:hypothetical protein
MAVGSSSEAKSARGFWMCDIAARRALIRQGCMQWDSEFERREKENITTGTSLHLLCLTFGSREGFET